MYRLAGGDVDGCDAYGVASVAHDVRRSLGVGLAAVREHDMLAHCDAAGDGLANLRRLR